MVMELSDGKKILSQINQALEDWRVHLIGGILLVMTGTAMHFKEVEEAFVELPAAFYLLLGLVSVAAGVRQFKRGVTYAD